MDSEGLSGAIRAALRAVDDAEVPEDLRAVALEVSLIHLLGAPAVAHPPPGGSGGGSGPEGRPTPPAGDSGGGTGAALDLIAEKAGVDRATVERLYHYNSERSELELVVSDKKIDNRSAEGSRELTLLVIGGRQAAGLEEWTPLKVARAACDHFKRADSNWSKNIVGTKTKAGLSEELTFRGSGQSRDAKVSAPGWRIWQELVQRLAS